MIDKIEQAIIAKLKADAELDIAVEVFPDKPNDYRLIHAKGAVLVAYRDTDFDDVGSSQETNKLTFVLSFLLRNLRQHKQSYTNLEKASDTLSRFYPLSGIETDNQSSTMQIIKQRYISENEGVWQYDQVYELTVYKNNAC